MQIPILALSLNTIQFSAILGDLLHKQDVYLQRQAFSDSTTCLFANNLQAQYLLCRPHPEIPEGNWSNHSLGTFFEHFYYSNLTFRLQYLTDLPHLNCNGRADWGRLGASQTD